MEDSLEKKKINRFALWGFIAGMVSLFFGWWICMLLPPLGLILSALGLAEIKRDPAQKGGGLAAAGLVFSLISILLASVFVVFVLVFKVHERLG